MKKIFIKINIFALFSIFLINWLGLLQGLSLQAIDFFFKHKQDESADPRIALVQIEEKDIERFQNYPFTESQWTSILDRIISGKPAVIGFDIFRDYPFPKNDRSLENFLSKRDDIIGITKLSLDPSRIIEAPRALAGRNLIGDVNVSPDPDQIVRRAYLWTYPKTYPEIPNLGLKLVLKYLNTKGIEPTGDERGNLRLGNVSLVKNPDRFGAYQTVDSGGYQIFLNWRKPIGGFLSRSISEVLDPSFDASIFKDKIILVGVGADTLTVKDLHPSPFGISVSGIEYQAQLVSSISSAVLDGRPLMRSWTEWQENLWLAFWITLFNIVFSRFDRTRAAALFFKSSILLLTILTFLWFHAFLAFKAGYWLPIVPLSLTLICLQALNPIALYLYRSREERERLIEDRESARNYILENEIYNSLSLSVGTLAGHTYDWIAEFSSSYDKSTELLASLYKNLANLPVSGRSGEKIGRQIHDISRNVQNCQRIFNNFLFRLSFLPRGDGLLPKEYYLYYKTFRELTRHTVITISEVYQRDYPKWDYLDNIIYFRVDDIEINSRSILPGHYMQIVTILVNNGLTALNYKNFRDGEKPRVRIVVTGSEDGLTISVSDNGIGLPESIEPRRLLDKFTSYWPAPNKKQGNELYRCFSILEEYDGNITFKRDGNITEITVFIPSR